MEPGHERWISQPEVDMASAAGEHKAAESGKCQTSARRRKAADGSGVRASAALALDPCQWKVRRRRATRRARTEAA